MDTTETITHIGLCAGYGGIELGLKRVLATLRTVALCEIEAFACANLVAKMEAGLMDPAPIWTDLKTFPWGNFCDRVDILTGGYPCQPFSAAGKRLGGEDARHLWPFISNGIDILRPKICFFENVEGHITQGLHHVLCDLGKLGYRTTWGIFSAAEVGAPHQRKRVFIMAYRSGARREWLGECSPTQGWQAWAGHTGGRFDVWPSRPGEPQHAWEPPRVVADSAKSRRTSERVFGYLGNAESTKIQRWDKSSQAIANCGDAGNEETGVVGNAQRADAVGDDAEEGSRTGMEVGRDCVLHAGGDEKEQFTDASGAEPTMGDTKSGARLGRASGDEGHAAQPGKAGSERQTQPALGGDANGPASGLDYAELCESCDNRTDELRLLGNGVVPATAALAFCTLLDELQRG